MTQIKSSWTNKCVVECLLQHLKAAKVDNLTFIFTPHALLALAKECRDVRAMVGVTQLLYLKEPFVYQGETMISITLAEITAAMRNKQIFDILERPTSDNSLAASTRSRYPAGSFFKPLHSDITTNLWVSSQYYQFSRYDRSTTQHEEDEVHGLTLSLGRAMGCS